MKHSFSNILVPVDFTINTEIAISKAMEVADTGGSRIFLLHISPSTENALRADRNPSGSSVQANKKLKELKNRIEEKQAAIEVEVLEMQHARVQDAVEKTAEIINADLIIIGKKSNHFWLPFLNTINPDTLAEKTARPVLTTKPGALNSRIKTLVVPVTSELPVKKMEMILALCKRTRVIVHLICFNAPENGNDLSAEIILNTYSWLSDSLHCPVVFKVLKGANKAKLLLDYAQKNNADLLLVRPQMETKTGWFHTNISDLIPAHSKVQVLTV